MCVIQTTIRKLTVKESYDELMEKMNSQWLELTEINSVYGELTGSVHYSEWGITINREFIVEIFNQ